jgi:hypothetical protein
MSKVKFVSSNDREIADKMALLREALRKDTLVCLSETHQQLDAALAKAEPDEYELIGCIDGTYGGRWMIAAIAENAAAVWPDNTAVYVRRVKR